MSFASSRRFDFVRLFFATLLILLVAGESLFSQSAVRIRETSTECGYYLVSAANTSSGVKVADFTEASFEEFLAQNPELEDQIVYIVGTELWGQGKKGKVQHAHETLALHGAEAVAVKTIDRPQGVFQHIRAFFPMKQHWQAITEGEVRAGISKLAISGMAPIVVLLLTQPVEIAVPVGLVNLIQSAIMTFPRQFWGNWQTSSNSFASRFSKQFLISAVFTTGLFWAAQLGETFLFSNEYPGHIKYVLSGLAWWMFIQSKWSSAVFQTLWRTPVHNGVYDWVNLKTKEASQISSAEGAKVNAEVRRSAGRIEMMASLVTTQFFIYASIAGEKAALFHFIFDWNVGHIGMATMGILGAIAWMKPGLWDPGAAVVNAVWETSAKATRPFTEPIAKIGNVTYDWIRDKIKKKKEKQEAEQILDP